MFFLTPSSPYRPVRNDFIEIKNAQVNKIKTVMSETCACKITHSKQRTFMSIYNDIVIIFIRITRYTEYRVRQAVCVVYRDTVRPGTR